MNRHINEENLDIIGSHKYLGFQSDSELKYCMAIKNKGCTRPEVYLLHVNLNANIIQQV